jgi:hypothetical protein
MRRSRYRRATQKSVVTIASLESALAAMAPAHDYRSDLYTLSGANLATIPNQGSAGGQLSVVAGTIAEPSADAALRGEKSWIAPGGQTVQSSLAVSAFRFVHDGTGAHTFCVYVPISAATAGIWATRAFTGTEIGAGVFYQASQSINFQVYNGSASEYLHASGGGTAPINAGCLIESSYLEGRAPFEADTRLGSAGALVNSTNTTNAPAAGDAVGTLRIGDSVGGAVQGRGRYARWIGFNRVLSSTEQATVRALMALRYGV